MVEVDSSSGSLVCCQQSVSELMHSLSYAEFHRLSQSASDDSVSIYLPTHVAGPEIQQDPIRLKNLLVEAQGKLEATGMDSTAAEQLLRPAIARLDRDRFWRHQSHGLALFLTPDSQAIYRLPLSVESLVVVSDRFHLTPLLPLFFEDRYFYLLALSQNQVRLFQSTRYAISEVTLEDVPTSLAAALQYDDPEEHLQFHSGGGAGEAPTYHGQGVGTTDDKEGIRRFFAKLNAGLHPYLNGETAPLVLAAVDYLHPLYHEANTYPHLMETGVQGNPDVMPSDELRQAAWKTVAAHLEQSHQQAVDQYHTLKGTGKASDRLAELVTAAHRGQVDVLFTRAHAHRWGQFEPESGQIEQHEQPHPRDRDLLDVAAVQTFLQGGSVYVLDAAAMPTDAPAAAVYRYGVPAEV